MSNQKTSAIIDSCAAAFKRTGLLRLAEEPSKPAVSTSTNLRVAPSAGEVRTYDVPATTSVGNAALDWQLTHPSQLTQPSQLTHPSQLNQPASPQEATAPRARALGFAALDEFLPDAGLPTGKVTELAMSGGAAWGTRVALWACRAAQMQAKLTGTESWCAYIDPSGSLNAPGVLATGVSLPRLLVLRPTLEEVERVVLRLSEARVFSVIVVDLVGVPWAIKSSPRSRPSRAALEAGAAEKGGFKRTTRGVLELNSDKKRQNWPRTVRQLAMRLANTQAQVILLTEGSGENKGRIDSQLSGSLPLPVALRVQMRSERGGVSLSVVKEAQGRVGAQVTIPWGTWWEAPNEGTADSQLSEEKLSQRSGRAKSLGVPTERVQSLLRPLSATRQARETDIAVVGSSRIARSSRASL